MSGAGFNQDLRKFRVTCNYQELEQNVSQELSVFSHTG